MREGSRQRSASRGGGGGRRRRGGGGGEETGVGKRGRRGGRSWDQQAKCNKKKTACSRPPGAAQGWSRGIHFLTSPALLPHTPLLPCLHSGPGEEELPFLYVWKRQRPPCVPPIPPLTTHLGPAVALGLVLVVGPSCLQHGLLGTASAGNLTDSATAGAGQDLWRGRGGVDESEETRGRDMSFRK